MRRKDRAGCGGCASDQKSLGSIRGVFFLFLRDLFVFGCLRGCRLFGGVKGPGTERLAVSSNENLCVPRNRRADNLREIDAGGKNGPEAGTARPKISLNYFALFEYLHGDSDIRAADMKNFRELEEFMDWGFSARAILYIDHLSVYTYGFIPCSFIGLLSMGSLNIFIDIYICIYRLKKS